MLVLLTKSNILVVGQLRLGVRDEHRWMDRYLGKYVVAFNSYLLLLN